MKDIVMKIIERTDIWSLMAMSALAIIGYGAAVQSSTVMGYGLATLITIGIANAVNTFVN